jgi:threonine dehydrogenase-like Zn-dependent dehydrogenase
VLAAVTRSPGNVVIDDIPEPGPPRVGRVVVRPETVGICGSDLHHFSGHTGALSGPRDFLGGVRGGPPPRSGGVFYPRIQGHEIAAVIEELGPDAPPALTPGMRVAVLPETRCGHCYPCRIGRSNVCVNLRLVGVHLDGGLQERLDIAAGAAFPAGDMDAGCAAFAEPMSIAVHALRRAKPVAGEKVLILGAGPIGLAAVLVALNAGLEPMAADPDPGRRGLATAIGAAGAVWGDPEDIVAAASDWTDGDGPPLIVEASGAGPALRLATETVSHAGRIVMVGMSAETAPVRPGIFPEKEIDVIGSSTACKPDFGEAVQLAGRYRAAVAKLLTHRFPLTATAEAFEFAMKREPGAVKTQITVSESSGGATKT